jgi:Fur family transcriptional regulator, ferric uptake regulator
VKKEFDIFNEFIRSKGLRHTPQREKILGVFLATEKHVSADDMHRILKRRSHDIGYTTVYRTMKLLAECGLCGEVDLGDGISRFEHKYGHKHHDHLICMKCGKASEVVDPEIERMQDGLAKKEGFAPVKHKLEIFGICRRCKGGLMK